MIKHLNIKDNVQNLMQKLEFPIEASRVLLSALEKILNDNDAVEQLNRMISAYDETVKCDYDGMLAEMKTIAERLNIHEYTTALLLFLCFGDKLRLRYEEQGIDEQIFYDSMADLRYKLEECRLVKNEVGSFVASWFAGFFNLTRLALGRLQFEIVSVGVDCEIDGVKLSKDSKAINMHIPRTGTRLDHEQVLDSYRRAAKFFRNEFCDNPIVFTCSSWLLDPWNKTALAPSSNLMAFFNDFEIVTSGEQEDYSDSWRLFDCEYPGNPELLPQDTSFRRAYVERMKKGEPLGWAQGVFIYKLKV